MGHNLNVVFSSQVSSGRLLFTISFVMNMLVGFFFFFCCVAG